MKTAARAFALLAVIAGIADAQYGPVTANPILFVTQNPVGNFGSVAAVFGNHPAGVDRAPRGGDLVLRYPDGTLRFLTQEAGFGNATMQGASAIAVREPCVHWSGTKALFAMVVGGPSQQYQLGTYRWQIYEVTGLSQGETAQIRKIANQPAFNNVSPIYGTDDRILFASDRPRDGASHHYPQRDEYESAPIVAGIYSLFENSGELTLIEHSPSGSTSLSLDSFGRVIFTKWDHLQRDQQGDAPATASTYQSFTFASEAANAATTTALSGAEVFPEARTQNDPAYDPALATHSFNHFFPWEINQDGTSEETLNHVGRQELGGSFTEGSFKNDPNLSYFTPPSLHANQLKIVGSAGLFHFREDPTSPGDFLATYAQEFGTGSGGTLMRLTGAPAVNPEDMVLTAVTPTSSDAQVPQATGYFRNPLPMSDGTLVAVHTAAAGYLSNIGTTQAPNWNYSYRLRQLDLNGGFYEAGAHLTAGISKNLSWWTPDAQASYSGPLWELDPVEVVARPVPVPRQSVLPAIESGVFAQEGVDVEAFRDYLRNHDLALIVSRNITQRDRADVQQPFNLKVPGGVQSIATSGTVYDVAHMQIFQGDAVRGYVSTTSGRRLLARPMHGPGVSAPNGGPAGSVKIAADGSLAALVPAQRALTWQLTDGNGAGVVRERNWLSFQKGEIRVCTSCHGINKLSQTGQGEPQNEPEALRELLQDWLAQTGGGGPLATPTPTASPSPTPTSTPPSDASDCASGVTLDRARLRFNAAPFRLQLRGEAVIPKPWAAIDPAVNGVRVVIPGALDITVPGGPKWTGNAGGTFWTYRDSAGTAGGVRRLVIRDHSIMTDGMLSLVMRIEGGGHAVPSPGPVAAQIHFGDDAECATAQWNGPSEAAPRCFGTTKALNCR